MTFSVLSSTDYETGRLFHIDCGNGSTVELMYALGTTEQQALEGASLYVQNLESQHALEAERQAEFEAMAAAFAEEEELDNEQ